MGLINPEVLFVFKFTGGLEVPMELPLEEDLDAGIRTTGFGIGLGAGFTGAGARFTVAIDAELFSELLELRREAREADLSTLNELARFPKDRFGSTGVRSGGLVSLVAIFFGISGDFFGTGDSQSMLQPDDAPCEALSELRLCVSSKPSSFNSCSLFTLGIRGDVVLSVLGVVGMGIFSIFGFIVFLNAFLDHTPVGVSVGDFSSRIAFCTSSWLIEVCLLILEYGTDLLSLVGVLSVLWFFSLSCQRFSRFSFSSFTTSSIGFATATSLGVSTGYDAWTSNLEGLIT